MLIRRLALFATLALPVAAHAQPPQVKPKSGNPIEIVKAEGDSLIGIPFVETFPGSMVPCPVKSSVNFPDHDVIKTMSGPCYFQKALNQFEILNGPDLGIGHTVELTTYRGYPALFVFTIARVRFPQMVQVFSTRYGQAHRTETVPTFTRAGGTFQFQSLFWEGKKARVRLDEGGTGDVRLSTAAVTSRFAEALRDSDKKRASGLGASKL